MQKPQKRLGRGLNSLISIPEQEGQEHKAVHNEESPKATHEIAMDMIRTNRYQPRGEIKSQDLQSLSASIKKSGVLQPIVVRPLKEGVYELLAGERRWRASQMAGLKVIPAVVREASDEEMLELALIENIQREDLNAIDRALAYRRYCDEFDLTAEEIASRMGEDRTTVTNYLRLLDLPSDVKEYVSEGQLSMGHARCLLSIKSPSELAKLAKEAIQQGLSVRALEKIVRERAQAREQASRPSTPPSQQKRPQIASLEQSFIRTLGTKVEINESRRKGNGKIIIHYYNLDDFDRVAERLGIEQ